MIAAHSLDFHPIRGDAQSILQAPGGLTMAESGRSVVRMWLGIMRSFGTMAKSYAEDLTPIASWKTDLIINQLPGALYGSDLAEKLGVPMLIAAVIPLTRTRAFPMVAFPSLFARIPGYNALTYRVGEQLAWQAFRSVINRWRREVLGLSPWSFWGHFDRLQRDGVPVLNGFSAHVVPRPPDWGKHVHITGYWFPEDGQWQPPKDLVRFVDSGPPPVFIGFGSMPVRDPERTTATVLDALAQSGQRCVLHAGWAGLGDGGLPDGVFQIEYAPYAWLFPRMAAVVHHGGSGTTGLGLWSGVPSLVVPFLFDQFYWGRRIAVLGVGPEPVPFRELSADRLAKAVTTAVTDSEMRRRAAALGEQIRAENGIGCAVQLAEQYGGVC